MTETIVDDSHCLWEALLRYMRGTPKYNDHITAKKCYDRLHVAVAEYYEQRLDTLPDHVVWFAQQVVDAYQDLYERKIVPSY